MKHTNQIRSAEWISGDGVDVEETVGTETQLLEGLGLLYFIVFSGIVAHEVELFVFCQFLHPGVSVFHFVLFLEMEDVDVSFLVSEFEGAYLLFGENLVIEFIFGECFDDHGSLDNIV